MAGNNVSENQIVEIYCWRIPARCYLHVSYFVKAIKGRSKKYIQYKEHVNKIHDKKLKWWVLEGPSQPMR